MAVKLNSLRFENPEAPPLVILHGLLGASRNWTTIGKALQGRFDVHIPDIRNHGNSPHADSMRWSELVADLALYVDAHDLGEIGLASRLRGLVENFEPVDAEDLNRLVEEEVESAAQVIRLWTRA